MPTHTANQAHTNVYEAKVYVLCSNLSLLLSAVWLQAAATDARRRSKRKQKSFENLL